MNGWQLEGDALKEGWYEEQSQAVNNSHFWFALCLQFTQKIRNGDKILNITHHLQLFFCLLCAMGGGF